VKKQGRKEIKKQRKKDTKNFMHVCRNATNAGKAYCTVERDKNYNSCERVQKRAGKMPNS
jgi:hypothetical protein